MDKFSSLYWALIWGPAIIAYLYGLYFFNKKGKIWKREILRAMLRADQRNMEALKQIKPTIRIAEKPIHIEKAEETKQRGEVYSYESDPMTILEGKRTEMFD